jgi:hypothetical protein
MVAHHPNHPGGPSKRSPKHSEGERLADELETLLERQDHLLKEAHEEHERLTIALRDLATAMERERKAWNEKPPQQSADTV